MSTSPAAKIFGARLFANFWNSPYIGRGAGSADDLAARLFGEHARRQCSQRLPSSASWFGPVGLALLLVSLGYLLTRSYRATLGSSTDREAAAIHWAAFLAVFGAAITMLFDNTIIELQIMGPLAVLANRTVHRNTARHAQWRARRTLARPGKS